MIPSDKKPTTIEDHFPKQRRKVDEITLDDIDSAMRTLRQHGLGSEVKLKGRGHVERAYLYRPMKFGSGYLPSDTIKLGGDRTRQGTEVQVFERRSITALLRLLGLDPSKYIKAVES